MTEIRNGVAVRKAVDVTGIVQGVGFRPFVYRLAHDCNLTGFIANTPSGVTIEVQGDDALVEKHYISKRSRRQKGLLAFLAQDARSRVFCYGNADLRQEQYNDEILRFVAFWKRRRMTRSWHPSCAYGSKTLKRSWKRSGKGTGPCSPGRMSFCREPLFFCAAAVFKNRTASVRVWRVKHLSSTNECL